MSALPLTFTPTAPLLSPQMVETRLRHANIMAARVQLLISSALVLLIVIFSAISGGIPPIGLTLLLGGWLVGSTLGLSLLALRADPRFLLGATPGRIALLCTLVTCILATFLIRDISGDFYLIYFFPIAVATIYYGLRGGVAAALLCAASYILLGVTLHDPSLNANLYTALAGRTALLFALVGTIGVGAEGQLALIREMERAYHDLSATTASLETTHRALLRRVQDDTMLDETARSITSTLDAQRVLNTVMERVEILLDAEASTLMTLDADHQELVYQILRGSRAPALRDYRVPVGQGICGWVAQHNEPLRVNNVAADPRHALAVDEVSGFKTRSLLAVPIVLQNRVTGVLEVSNKRHGAFSDDDERLLCGVARWAAIALENAHLYNDLQSGLDQLERAQGSNFLRNERLRTLGEMAGGVAHDFNNFLTVILAESQMLGEDLQDPAQRAAVSRIEQAARDGALAVRRIQEFSRIRRDAPDQVVDVHALLSEVAAMTRPRWAPVGKLTLELQEPGWIKAAPGELRQVLMNLVFNAIDARREYQPVQLIVRARRDGPDWVSIEVQDNGTGIPPELRQHIFDPYFTTKPHGTGLGLSITYGLVTRHGGEIQVTSPLVGSSGETLPGTLFTLRLPATERAAKEQGEMSSTTRTGRTANILFVDDDPNILSAASSLLNALGHRVSTAQTRAEAETRMQAGLYDILMTDLSMPECSGWDLAKRSKELWKTKPVILVTGWGLTLDNQQLKSGLVNGVLSKPFTLDELQTTLNELAPA